MFTSRSARVTSTSSLEGLPTLRCGRTAFFRDSSIDACEFCTAHPFVSRRLPPFDTGRSDQDWWATCNGFGLFGLTIRRDVGPTGSSISNDAHDRPRQSQIWRCLIPNRGEGPVAFPHLIHPMIDYRSVTPTSCAITHARKWNRENNTRARNSWAAIGARGTNRSMPRRPRSATGYIPVGALDLFGTRTSIARNVSSMQSLASATAGSRSPFAGTSFSRGLDHPLLPCTADAEILTMAGGGFQNGSATRQG